MAYKVLKENNCQFRSVSATFQKKSEIKHLPRARGTEWVNMENNITMLHFHFLSISKLLYAKVVFSEPKS